MGTFQRGGSAGRGRALMGGGSAETPLALSRGSNVSRQGEQGVYRVTVEVRRCPVDTSVSGT